MKLFTWNWTVGGYNQEYAENLEDLKVKINQRFPSWKDKVDWKTVKENSPEEEKKYWDNFPLWD